MGYDDALTVLVHMVATSIGIESIEHAHHQLPISTLSWAQALRRSKF